MQLSRFYMYTVTVIAALLLATSCSDDEVIDDPSWSPNLSGDSYYKGAIITVTSESSPKSGQKHRSSDNFSTVGMLVNGNTPDKLYVSCPPAVTFKVQIDKTGPDGTLWECVYNGALLNYSSGNNYYIADPAGTTGNFKIKFTALGKKSDNVYVSCRGSLLPGQEHRASDNFRLPSKYTRFLVHVSNPKVSFDIYEDISVAKDHVIAQKVMDGHYINLSSARENYYLANPMHSDPFMVTFEPVTVEWMKGLSDDIPITSISTPGTHDSGTGSINDFNLGYAKCQNFDFAQQLDFGIRYFDMRVGGDMEIYHNFVDCDISFEQVLNDARAFLREHSSESIFMEISDNDDDMPQNFKKFIREKGFGDLFYRGTQVPRLGDVRGKIVILRRFNKPDNDDWGIDIKSIWPGDTWDSGTNPDGVPYYIEDRYYSASEPIHDSKEKSRLLRDAVNHAIANPKCMTIGFASIAARGNHTPWDYAWGGGVIFDVDPIMSQSVSDILDEVESSHTTPLSAGWIILDYYSREGHDDYLHNVERIINLNFPKDKAVFNLGKLHSDRD